MLPLPLDVTEAGINLTSHSSPPQTSPLNLCLHTHFFRSNSSLEHLTKDVTAYDQKKKVSQRSLIILSQIFHFTIIRNIKNVPVY